MKTRIKVTLAAALAPLFLFWVGGGDLLTRNPDLAGFVFFALLFGTSAVSWPAEYKDEIKK